MPSSEVMHKFNTGVLRSGSAKGPRVKSRKQAIAIMLSEKRAEDKNGGEYPEKTQRHERPFGSWAPAIAALFAVLSLSACGVEQQEVGVDEFRPEKVAYFRDDRTKVCFAVVSYQRIDTGGRSASGLSHSYVPCTPEVIALLRRQAP